MYKVAAGIIVGLLLGIVIGYQFAPGTDTSELEGTIDLLLEEVDTKNQILEQTRVQIDVLEDSVVELEAELKEVQHDLDNLNKLITISGGWEVPDWNHTVVELPKTVVYQLQNYDLDALEAVGADLYIIDYSWEGDDESRFTPAEVARLQDSSKVLSYISIGEAEDYRWYWQGDWTEGEPSWLGATNPEWEGNYKVRYWDPEWQEIVFDYIDSIMGSGFNGIYLDIIDAYEYWGPEGDSGLDRDTAEQDMVDFVIAISGYAKARNPDFLIYPQNGEALGVHPEYLAAVDGIGREDVWYNDNELQPDTNTTLGYLELFSDSGKHVIVIDYPTDPELVADFCEKARVLWYSPYPGGRELDDIRTCPD